MISVNTDGLTVMIKRSDYDSCMALIDRFEAQFDHIIDTRNGTQEFLLGQINRFTKSKDNKIMWSKGLETVLLFHIDKKFLWVGWIEKKPY